MTTSHGLRCALFLLILCGLGWHSAQDGRSDAPSEQRLVGAMDAALQSGDLPKAIEYGLQLVERSPGNSTYAYNLACAYARSADADNSVKWLQAAADRGCVFLATMQRDEDLSSVRNAPGFDKALAGVKANSDRDLEAFKKRVADIEPIIVLPPGHESTVPAPLILALHPTGGHASDFIEVWRKQAANAGAILAGPQGMLAARDGWRWGKVEHGDWLVLHAIEMVKRKHAIDDQRIIVTGFSEGGSVSFVAALRHPEVFAGAIPMCGEYVPQVSPVIKPDEGARTPRMYIITGEHDRDVKTNRLAERELENAGYPVILREFKGMGHSLPPNHEKQFAAAVAWVLKPDN